MKKPFEVYILCLFLLFLSVGALYGGGGLIISPDGSLLKMDKTWLDKIPFHSYLIPGLILFTLLGIFPLVALAGLFIRKSNRFFNFINIYPNISWGLTFSLYSGIISIIWIIVQQLTTEYFILQPIISGVGITIIILSLLPNIQKFYTK